MRVRTLCASLLLLLGCDPATPADAGPEGGIVLEDGGPITDAGMSAVDAGDPGDAALECPGDDRLVTLVYFGTAEPTVMPLTEGQILAVVDFGGCSGTFVADEWVLTADHCGITVGRQLCVGPDPTNADVCFVADRVETHPSVDMALVHVDAPASARIPQLEPIPILTESLDNTWLGRTAEAAGYGTQETNASGEREFTAEPISDVGNPYVAIDGMGERGVCFGDSGGPLMVLASDSTVRVAGALSFGDPSCVGVDSFTRVDLQREWLEAILGPTVVDGAPCGALTAVGDCVGTGTAVWCDETTGEIDSEACAAPATCGWDAAAAGFRCVTDDPCGGVSAAGRCEGGVASWCEEGAVRSRDCGACGQLCRYLSEVSGFFCAPDPCIGTDPQGECDGSVLTECDSDEGVTQFDCAQRGRICGFNERRGRNTCMRP